MANRVLPSRNEAMEMLTWSQLDRLEVWELIVARGEGKLLTAAEWRETIDYEATFTSKYDPDTNSYGHPMEMGDWFWQQGKGEKDVTFALLRLEV